MTNTGARELIRLDTVAIGYKMFCLNGEIHLLHSSLGSKGPIQAIPVSGDQAKWLCSKIYVFCNAPDDSYTPHHYQNARTSSSQ